MSFPHRFLLRTAAVVGVVALGVSLASCSSDEPTDTPAEGADADATLRVGLRLEPTNLDIRHTSGAALEAILADNIYQGLVTRTGEGEIVPALATEWTESDDGLSYDFMLAEGVTFHNGGELTPSDVVSSLQAVIDDDTYASHGDLSMIDEITATDTGVHIALTEPYRNFLFVLTTPAGFVFDEGDDADLKTTANGTGPFVLDEWRQGDGLTLLRNDSYYGEPAGVAEVDVSYFADATAGVNAASGGDVDVLTPVEADLVPQLEGANGFEIVTGRTTDKYILGFNNTAAPLDDVRVREALRLAINHDALVETIGAGATQYGPIPELDPGYEDLSEVAPYDTEKAKELLAEAGVSDLELTLTIPNVYGTTASSFLVSAFADIGVTLDVKPVEFSTWLQDVYTNGDYELSFVNHVEPRDVNIFTDPDYYFHYDNAKVQELYDEAMTVTNEEESNVLLAEVGRQVAEDHPVDWLYTAEQLTAIAPGVENFPADSLNSRLPLAGVTVTAQ